MTLRGGHSLQNDDDEEDSLASSASKDRQSSKDLHDQDESSISEIALDARQGKQVDWDPDEWSEGEEIKEPSDSLPDTFVPTQPTAPGESEWTDAPCAEETNEDVPLEDRGVTVRFALCS